jgi:hypothetical protein
MDEVEREVRAAMQAYVKDFARLDPAATAAHVQTPCLLLADQGAVAVTTPEAVVAQLTALMEGLRARGYTGGGYTDLHVAALGERTALVSAAAVRYGMGGRELERIGATYALHRGDAGWKITMLITHPPDRILPLR